MLAEMKKKQCVMKKFGLEAFRISMTTIYEQTLKTAEELGKLCIKKNIVVGSAESCTGGMIAAACTEISGSSSWFKGGIVAYDPAIKKKLLSVPEEIISEFGVVSKPTALNMASGAIAALDCNAAVATTGYAGPTGGDENNPCGTVYIAAAYSDKVQCERHCFNGTRFEVRQQATLAALKLLQRILTTI